MSPAEVLAFVGTRSQWTLLRAESAQYWRSGAAVRVRDDGRWELDRAHGAVRSARKAVADRVIVMRQWAERRPDPGVIETTRRRIAGYEIIGAVDVRALLRTLNIDPGERRLAELGPPQKTRQLNGRGRTLTITSAFLVQGSCGISRPFGDERMLRDYLRDGAATKLRRRLEADAKSLFALYQYGRLHGGVRLRWGFLDEMLPAPWVHRDESTLYDLLKDAHQRSLPLEVVVGSAPGLRRAGRVAYAIPARGRAGL